MSMPFLRVKGPGGKSGPFDIIKCKLYFLGSISPFTLNNYAMENREVVIKTMKSLENKLGGQIPPCLLCGHNKWSVPNKFTIIDSYEVVSNTANPSDALIRLPLTCTNCGNTLNIDPKVLGALD